MSRDGRKFFYFSSSFFADRKIKILKARYGADGMILYIYLLCEIYREEGYFLAYDDDFKYIVAAELCMSYEKIGQIMNFLLERSLFDNTLFQSDKVLTSREIQATFQEAVKGKGSKNPVVVRERLWLLEKNETAAYIKVQPEISDSENLPPDSEKTPRNSENLPLKQSKVKQSKVKQSKAKQSAAAAAAGRTEAEEAFAEVTGRKMTEADRRALGGLKDGGIADALIAGVIRDVGSRRGQGKINSFAYFIPAIREAARGSADTGLYPATAAPEYIETVLDEEYLDWLGSVADDTEEYDYDDE